MATWHLEARGRAPVDEAWRRYAEIQLWPTWAPQISRVQASSEHLALGVRGTVYVLGLLPFPFTITSCRPEDRTWSWLVRIGPVELALTHAVEHDGTGSCTTLDIEGPALVVFAYAPVARIALDRLVR
jgi:hypothetical protein